ncbi:hypothetical protein Ae201684P_009459 [Aphanomyces euteiches]|nr:hypothetical protein Ae201684P_009459 [Aphanomyces euteiches]
MAATYGQLEVLQFLHKINHMGCSKQAIDEAATHGHLAVVKWLFDNRDDGFTANAWNGASQNGHRQFWIVFNHTKKSNSMQLHTAGLLGSCLNQLLNGLE